uniref:Tetraspanin n=1 Tax=Panagrolaimus sp. JU765 TaxID=591449 RepID=A0AC34QTC7_9BILA
MARWAQSFFLLVLLISMASAESRIICTRRATRSLCRPRFALLKNDEYRSMLQAIADRQVALSGSLALRRPSTVITDRLETPSLSYQDIMHNLLMKSP